MRRLAGTLPMTARVAATGRTGIAPSAVRQSWRWAGIVSATSAAEEIAKLVHKRGGRLALGKLIHSVSPQVKAVILASGRGLEGFVRQFNDFEVAVEGGEKRVILNDPERFGPLPDPAAAAQPAQASSPPAAAAQTSTSPSNGSSSAAAAGSENAAAPKPPPVPEAPKSAAADQPVAEEPPSAAVDEATPTAPEAEVTRDAAAAPEPEASPVAQEEEDAPAAAAAAAPEEAAPQASAQAAAPAAAAQTSTAAASSGNGAATDDVDEDMEEAMARSPDDPNIETRRRVLKLLAVPNAWYNANELHQALYRGSTAVPYSDFALYLRGSPDFYWYHKGTVARRLKSHKGPPPKDNNLVVSKENIKKGYVRVDGWPNTESSPPMRPDAAAAQQAANAAASASASSATTKVHSGPSDRPAAGTGLHEVPTQANNWGGWGAAPNVPTSADVFEILKYVPVHWTNLGDIRIPPPIKKKHIRVSKPLTWYARQPRYFDVRVASGTIEVRRSVLLHPEAHNLTKEEAEAIVEKRIAADKEAGEPIPVKLARETANTGGAAKKSSTGGVGEMSSTAVDEVVRQTASSGTSPSQDAVVKILLRVCPGYFVTTDTIIRRATKKLDITDIVTAAERCKSHIDLLTVTSKTDPSVTKTFLRRKAGVEATRWEADFVAELENSQNLELLCECMSRCCAQWDRVHFLYVRLPDEVKSALDGFDGMVDFLRAHPHVFLVGEYFFKRIDSSDPNFDTQEPESNRVTSTKQLEDNPYHLSKELALVFQYLTPEDQPCSLSHFVECCSPAMKSVLPPRLITIVQSHPELLTYREVSPGTYAISRALGDEGEEAFLSPEDTLEEVLKLVPPRGIDAAHLMNTLQPSLRGSVVKHYGPNGMLELVQRNQHLFHVVRNPPYTTLFLRKPRRDNSA